MASPQIAGILACLLQIRETYTQDEMRAFVEENGQKGRLYDSGVGVPATDYGYYYALHGANNLFAMQPFNSNIAFRYGT